MGWQHPKEVQQTHDNYECRGCGPIVLCRTRRLWWSWWSLWWLSSPRFFASSSLWGFSVMFLLSLPWYTSWCLRSLYHAFATGYHASGQLANLMWWSRIITSAKIYKDMGPLPPLSFRNTRCEIPTLPTWTTTHRWDAPEHAPCVWTRCTLTSCTLIARSVNLTIRKWFWPISSLKKTSQGSTTCIPPIHNSKDGGEVSCPICGVSNLAALAEKLLWDVS